MTDSDHWTDWITQHGPSLVLAARQWVPDPAAAEDVVQEAFLHFFPARHRARDPLAMLYVCVKRSALQWHRQSRRRLRREEAAARRDATGPSLFIPMQDEERRQLIEIALLQLPEPQREVVVMKIWVGLSFPQIAETLGTSANTVASRYRYALERLREQLAEESIP
jgi:RNA polymerase sigma-70 factor (ECF subfamily)